LVKDVLEFAEFLEKTEGRHDLRLNANVKLPQFGSGLVTVFAVHIG